DGHRSGQACWHGAEHRPERSRRAAPARAHRLRPQCGFRASTRVSADKTRSVVHPTTPVSKGELVMNRLMPSTLLALGLNGAVVAQSGAPSIPTPTHDWGCEVLLCLANPNGPTAVAPCVPPIRRLWRELARGHAFPTCAMATGPS